MRHEGRGVIRLGDKTDHGGYVISASSGSIVMGKEAALANDMIFCPRCKGQFPIQPDGKGARHAGRSYAYHDDVAACGARLISSLTPGDKRRMALSMLLHQKTLNRVRRLSMIAFYSLTTRQASRSH